MHLHIKDTYSHILSCSLWRRCTRDGGPGFQARLRENLGLFFDARHVQSEHRQMGVIPTTQDYIDIRRDSSGLKPLMDLLEYTLHMDLPDCVIEDPCMMSLKQCVNDFCTWSNVRIQSFQILYTGS
jgi:alpha-muurolene/germacrene-A/gamma-muurolene/(+)-delta-cadinol synthase